MEFLLPTFCPRIYVKCEKYLNYSSRNKNVLHIITMVTDAKKEGYVIDIVRIHY